MKISQGFTESGIDVSDIHATGKAVLDVHHNDLAVVAVFQP